MKSIMIAILSLCSVTLLMAQSPQVRFDQANSWLEKGEFRDAMEVYRGIESDGYRSGALFLNMGIVATELDSMGLAKYYFERSAGFSETAERAENALEYVNAQFSRQSVILPKLPWDNAVEWLIHGPGATGVFFIGFILVLTAFILVMLNWYHIFTLNRHDTVIATLIIISVSTVVLSFYTDYVDQRYKNGVVVDTELRVVADPENDPELVSMAYEGYSVTVDLRMSGEHQDLLYIRLGNGQYGWIERSGVRMY